MEKKKHHPHQRNFESVFADLKKSGLKLTEPRKAILQALVENHGPYSAEEIHKLFTKKVCDQVTVYRCLTSLEKAGMIKRCEFGDGTARYEFFKKEHHHHVICKECKKIEVLDDCELQEIDRFARKKGFTDVSHSLEFFGICSDCK